MRREDELVVIFGDGGEEALVGLEGPLQGGRHALDLNLVMSTHLGILADVRLFIICKCLLFKDS